MITTTTIISSFTICIFAIYIIFSPAITKHIDQAPTSNFLHVRLSELRNQRNFYRWNPEKGKFSLVKSGILGFEVLCPENPESKLHWQAIRNPVPGMKNYSVESRVQDCLRACLRGGGGFQVGEVTCDGSPNQQPTCHVNLIKLKWEITWTGGLPHLPGVPHLHVNRPLDFLTRGEIYPLL